MATREEWIGRVGREWARHGGALERLMGEAGQCGLDALAAQPGELILDLGCGTGTSTEALAELVDPGGSVTGIDVSPDLLAVARERLAARTNVDLIEADAETYAFEPGFDALYSRFGATFFADPPAAFANLHRALKPGARVVIVAWREAARNQWASVPMTFVIQGLAGPGPQPGPGPFAWADRGVFLPLLEGAGFHDVTTSTHECMTEIGGGDDPDPVRRAIHFITHIGPLAARLRDASDESRREAEAFLERRLARHVHDGAVRLLASAWIIEARA